MLLGPPPDPLRFASLPRPRPATAGAVASGLVALALIFAAPRSVVGQESSATDRWDPYGAAPTAPSLFSSRLALAPERVELDAFPNSGPLAQGPLGPGPLGPGPLGPGAIGQGHWSPGGWGPGGLGPGVGTWELLPNGSLYPFYLADVKASRLAARGTLGEEDYLEGSLGGRVGLIRLNETPDGPYRRGVQLDVEGASLVRLNTDRSMDLESSDFRAGVPLSVSLGRLHTRFGYYHLSAHVGDEFLLRNPGFNRLNVVRDALFAGVGYWLTPARRLYAETSWAFYHDVSQPWDLRFGIEQAPRFATGLGGAPFFAIHGHLRQEFDFGGYGNLELGWAWRGHRDSGMLRVGLFYVNGKSTQFAFFDKHEQLYGGGIWYDF